ncbi:MAG: ABC transporter ATP-binding protein [Candidatus Sumerlaeaceae bacterium]|nr:ABC transporter ATP-binding protein [Candidatus Sumerlaeaceae bacterium]
MNDTAAGTTGPSGVVLEAQHVAKDYHDGTRILHVLRDVSIQVRRGEIVSIVGASGVGKSTLLHVLGAIDRPTRGSVTLGGRDLTALSDRELARVRAESIGFIFQFHHLLAEFSAQENVVVPALILGRDLHQQMVVASDLLTSLGLGDRLTHRPAKLSGGEQQRVALARALINNPDVILADEPTGNLDTETAETVISLLWQHTRDKHRSLVIVTHEPSIARRADRCLRLREGRLVPEPAPAETEDFA